MPIEFPDKIPRKQRLAFSLLWSCRQVGRIAHGMQDANKLKAARAMGTEKVVFATMLTTDLYDLGLLQVQMHTDELLAISWWDQSEVGVHIPRELFTNEWNSRSFMLWSEWQRLKQIAYGEATPECDGSTYKPSGWRLLEYLGIMTRACGHAPADSLYAQELLYGVCEVSNRLIESGCMIRRGEGSRLCIGNTEVNIDKGALERSLQLMDGRQGSRCHNLLIDVPRKKRQKPRKLR